MEPSDQDLGRYPSKTDGGEIGIIGIQLTPPSALEAPNYNDDDSKPILVTKEDLCPRCSAAEITRLKAYFKYSFEKAVRDGFHDLSSIKSQWGTNWAGLLSPTYNHRVWDYEAGGKGNEENGDDEGDGEDKEEDEEDEEEDEEEEEEEEEEDEEEEEEDEEEGEEDEEEDEEDETESHEGDDEDLSMDEDLDDYGDWGERGTPSSAELASVVENTDESSVKDSDSIGDDSIRDNDSLEEEDIVDQDSISDRESDQDENSIEEKGWPDVPRDYSYYHWVLWHGLPVLVGLTPFSGSCKLCRIETWFPEPYLRDESVTASKYALRAVQSSGIFGAPGLKEDWPILGRFKKIIALRLWDQTSQNHIEGVEFVSIPPSIGSMRSLRSDSIDFSVLQFWLQFCRDNHTTTCGISQIHGRIHIKLIDCETRKLVDGGDLPYLTLSYLWSRNEEPPKYSEKLPDTAVLPKTINDAIAATLKLGFRYIWIDRYCINQYDHEDALRQIRQMDVIYRNSEVTIIAAAGDGPSYGLPGVGDRHRRRQFQFQIDEHSFVGPLRFMDAMVRHSHWASRGWTFQEGMLSRRRLVFTDDQVYYECRGMYCYEAINLPLEKLHHKVRQRVNVQSEDPWPFIGTKRVFHSRLWEGTDPQSSDIYEKIRHYSSRKFTKSSDRLNAFLGMLNDSNTIYGIRHLWGVPNPPDKELDKNARVILVEKPQYSSASFLKGLFFESTSGTGLTRIPNLPSWSWAGWDGSVIYEEFLKRDLHTQTDVNVSIELKNGQLLNWGDFHDRYLELSDYSQMSHFLHISAPVALAYVEKDRSPEGKVQCMFHLDNGYHLRATLKDIVECAGDIYHGIIWATRGSRVFVILTTKVEDGFKRVGAINSLGGELDELLTPAHKRICRGNHIEDRFGSHWWKHLKTEVMTLRLS